MERAGVPVAPDRGVGIIRSRWWRVLVYTDVGAMVGQGEGCQRRQKGKGTGKRERGRDGGHGQRRKRRLNCPMMYFFFLFFGRRRESSHEPIQRCTFSCNHRSTIFDFLIRFDNFCFYFFVAILFSLQFKVRFFFLRMDIVC